MPDIQNFSLNDTVIIVLVLANFFIISLKRNKQKYPEGSSLPTFYTFYTFLNVISLKHILLP